MSHVTVQSDVVAIMATRGIAAIDKERQANLDAAIDEAMKETSIFGKYARYASREAALESIKGEGMFNAYQCSRMLASEARNRLVKLKAMTKASIEVHVDADDFYILSSWNKEDAE